MDLVQSYDSEMDNDTDIEEININPSIPKTSKQVDVIDLGSDSEDESTSHKNKIDPSTVPEKVAISDSNQNIDCIDLDNSDSSAVNTPRKDPQRKETIETPSDSVNKKIDYLNLEGSDSDVECGNENKIVSVSTLLDSASTLNDIPSGPQKPSEILDSPKCITESMAHSKELDDTSVSSSNVHINCDSSRNTPDFVHCNLSRDSTENSFLEPSCKRFKGESAVEISNFVDNLDKSETEKNNLCLYRKDDRIINETKKNLLCRIPRQVIQTHNAHANIITSLNWCIPQFSYLYLSSSFDGSIKIWDLFSKNSVQCIKSDYGFSAAKWSLDGGQIIAGGKGKKAYVFDVPTGKKIVDYDIYNIVTSMEIHPYMEDVFLCGTRNAILGFDIRVNTTFPIRSFFSKCEEVLDIAFLDENEFICSTNIVSQDSADRTIMAWDFSSGAILSNQIYLERFTCPSLKVHPSDSSFIAQSNGNYIASFSASRPYKIKNKRYVGHKVSGYGIECDISPDGKYVVSGDAEGSVYFYNYSNTNTVLVTPCERKIPINKVKWHPAYSSTLITSTYDGQIHVWK